MRALSGFPSRLRAFVPGFRLALSGLALAAGCATSAGPTAETPAGHASSSSSPSAAANELRLTATAPSQETAEGAGVGVLRGTPEILELSVVGISNPSSQSFSIKASLIQPDGVADIGTVSPYPPDATGTYMAVVPSALRSVVVAQAHAARVRLTLVPLSPDRLLAEPLEVVVAAPVWRSAR